VLRQLIDEASREIDVFERGRANESWALDHLAIFTLIPTHGTHHVGPSKYWSV
jgi:hypothetical protein